MKPLADPVDLHISRAGVFDGGFDLLMVRQDSGSAHSADVSFRQNFLWHDDMEEMFAAGRGGVERFAIR